MKLPVSPQYQDHLSALLRYIKQSLRILFVSLLASTFLYSWSLCYYFKHCPFLVLYFYYHLPWLVCSISTTFPAVLPHHISLYLLQPTFFCSHTSFERTWFLKIFVTWSRCRTSNPFFLLSRRQRARFTHRNFTMALHPVFPTTSSRRINRLLSHLQQHTRISSRLSHPSSPALWVLVSVFPSTLVTTPPLLHRPPLNPRAQSVSLHLAIRSDRRLYLCHHRPQTQRHHPERISMVADFVSSRRWSSRRTRTHPGAQYPGAQHPGVQRLFGRHSRRQTGRYAIMIRPAVRSLSAWSRLSRARWPTSALSLKHRQRESGASVAKPRKSTDNLGLRVLLFDSCILLVGGFSVGAGFGVESAFSFVQKSYTISPVLYCLTCLCFLVPCRPAFQVVIRRIRFAVAWEHDFFWPFLTPTIASDALRLVSALIVEAYFVYYLLCLPSSIYSHYNSLNWKVLSILCLRIYVETDLRTIPEPIAFSAPSLSSLPTTCRHISLNCWTRHIT